MSESAPLSLKQNIEERRKAMMKLMKEKDQIEKEILDLTEILETPPMPGVKGPLVDSEGFPRADIDLFEVRRYRNRLACLQTDHCNLMKEIEKGLESLHSDYIQHNMKDEEVKTSATSANTLKMGDLKIEDGSQSAKQEVKIPFAWVSDVISESPAQKAGLKLGDAIYRFGEVDHSNHENLGAIVELVKRSLNNTIKIKVLRKNIMGSSEDIEIDFVPHEWGGRGYLGCALKLHPI